VEFQRELKPAPENTGRAGGRFFMLYSNEDDSFTEDDFLTEEENLEENLRIDLGVTLRKERSGLSANLYLDDAGSWRRLRDRRTLKFQPNIEDFPEVEDMVLMSIDDNPQILDKDAKIELDAKQLDQIKAFVRANKDLLVQLADADISCFKFIDGLVKV
jgi:hypothetical protein